jgi:arsenate reductase-like glutaredoxin family protein
MVINLLGIDIAKNVFQLHGVGSNGIAILKKRLSRGKLTEYIANLGFVAEFSLTTRALIFRYK